MKPAVIYTRVSTRRQVEEGGSLEAQEARCRAYCASHGMDVIAVYSDEGVCGARSDRKGLSAAADHVTACQGTLVFYAMSRIARGTKMMIEFADDMGKRGANLASVSEPLDTSSATGIMFFQIMSVLNEFERNQLRERTREALQRKIELGECAGGVPMCKRRVMGRDGEWRDKLVDDKKEIELCEMMRKMRDEDGMSLDAIAVKLNADGITNRFNKPFQRMTVWRRLKRYRAFLGAQDDGNICDMINEVAKGEG